MKGAKLREFKVWSLAFGVLSKVQSNFSASKQVKCWKERLCCQGSAKPQTPNSKPFFLFCAVKNRSLEHLIFAAYLVLFAWLVTQVPFFTKSGLSRPQVVIVFLLKVMAGILYGWIGVYYGELAQMVDTWSFHFESVNEYRLLLS